MDKFTLALAELLLMTTAAFAQQAVTSDPPPATPIPLSSSVADCNKWSIKGVRLGMTLKEVKAEHKSLGHGRNYFRPEDKREGWYVWTETRWRGLYNYVLPERDEADAKIISVVAAIDVPENASATIDALIERWGEPLSREAALARVRYFNVFGNPDEVFDWLGTTWEDPKCDILVTVHKKTETFKVFTVSLDSISQLDLAEKPKEKDREKARKAVRP